MEAKNFVVRSAVVRVPGAIGGAVHRRFVVVNEAKHLAGCTVVFTRNAVAPIGFRPAVPGAELAGSAVHAMAGRTSIVGIFGNGEGQNRFEVAASVLGDGNRTAEAIGD